ncbi:carboxymuconolactone decarboxylase family protein [Sphingomonas sp. DG1-23]|uniref:carboxymuconolactone decarboxylase family protein n=1 Tax=Sphingomonas sp. DG1-23 TaxID=3068316 RepID=UPI00273D7A38|nr:carboxymuconolactone decarboxylase family protein [Sphingomonas sp. DG1-23]MDP5277910.1 carboxymuconolactone decarboxylase family protein [Sphingomonas sp. DG1-23]
MTQRLDPFAAAPAQMQTWLDMSLKIAPAIEPGLLELVKIRASQINGCANCLNMHTADARKAGETEQRIYLLSAWHEAPLFSARERAALAWTDALTLISTARAPQELYDAFAAEFTPEEQVQLTLMINAINGWNRIAVGFDLFYKARPAHTQQAA